MCGILGTVNRPFGESTLSLLAHRGPDDSGMSATQVGAHLLTLGQRRLSILDLSPAGHQPMWTRDNAYGIVFNGEVYNHRELRDRLVERRYRGHSDTETILQGFAERGLSWLDELNGIFALALIDVRAQKVFLARDPFGVKPVYYSGDGNSFVFSSELRGIRAFVDAPLELANLAELLRLRYLPAPDTLFRNIYKVRPGHVLEVDLGGERPTYREYPFVKPIESQGSLSRLEAVERYGRHIEQAVKRQLLSDVEVGVFLSGGIDSAIVASLAQKHAGYKMSAFTVGFTGQHTEDEIGEARETADVLGLDHHEVRIGFPEFLDLLPRITAIVEEPLATTSIVPMFYVSLLASKHVKVVLSGQGADEALGGYRRYRAELIRSFIPPLVLPAITSSARLLRLRNDTLLRGLSSVHEVDDVHRFEKTYGVFTPNDIDLLIGHQDNYAAERIRYVYDLLGCGNLKTSVARMMAVDLRMSLADDLLLYTDKITMHHSLECRVPLLDVNLVRFIESLAISHRVNTFRGKIIHKEFAKSILPASIIRRKKKGFLSPTGDWFKATGPLQDILLSQTSGFASYFNLSEVAKVLHEHASGLNRERQVFILLSVYYWIAQMTDADGAPHSEMAIRA